MNPLVKFSSQFTSTCSLLVMGIVYITFMVYFFKFAIPQVNTKALDSELGGYSLQKVHETMEKMGEDGRRAYCRIVSPVDMIFAAFYSIFESAWLVRLYGTQRKSPTSNSIVKFIVFSPYIGGLSDICENIFTFSFAFFYPAAIPDWAVNVASTFTIVKYSNVFSTLLFIILGIVKNVFFGGKPHRA
eukprot:Phypoly_transcript_10023.p2 GENE.Phypoly_transcript_10023~~Phypoly_transcript_10023.p2  ORF type:complete len:187 (+),score=21.16 Phypoly_transcript_10023:775-1335(+)